MYQKIFRTMTFAAIITLSGCARVVAVSKPAQVPVCIDNGEESVTGNELDRCPQ